MSAGRRKRPSGGFIGVCLTYALVAAFFVWGFATPDLDRVWTLHHVLKTGQLQRLSAEDHALLTEAMLRHEELATALLDGHDIGIISAHEEDWIATPTVAILRTTKSQRYRSIALDVQTPKDLLPVTLTLEGTGWRKQEQVEGHGRLNIELPPAPRRPEIVELTVTGAGVEADPSVLGMRVTFPEGA